MWTTFYRPKKRIRAFIPNKRLKNEYTKLKKGRIRASAAGFSGQGQKFSPIS